MTSDASITARGKVIWIGLIVFVAAWMFVLGIMVGRGTAPVSLINQSLENGLAELRAAIVKPAPDGQGNQSVVEEQSIPLTELKFYEDLKETTPNIRPLPTLPQTARTPDKPKPEIKKITPEAEILPEPVANRKSTPEKPETAVNEASESSIAATASQTKSRFTIQVAAVQDARNAEKLVEELRSKGFNAYQIQSRSENGSTLHRVRVGAFEDRPAAEAILAGLRKNNFTGLILRTP